MQLNINRFICGGANMCDKKGMDDFFEFLGFQEALKNSQSDKSKDTLDDIFNTKENPDDNDKNSFWK